MNDMRRYITILDEAEVVDLNKYRASRDKTHREEAPVLTLPSGWTWVEQAGDFVLRDPQDQPQIVVRLSNGRLETLEIHGYENSRPSHVFKPAVRALMQKLHNEGIADPDDDAHEDNSRYSKGIYTSDRTP